MEGCDKRRRSQGGRLWGCLFDFEVRLTALECKIASKSGLEWHSPVEIRRLNVTQTLWFTGTDDKHVRWNEVVALQSNHVPYPNILPFLFFERLLSCQYLGFPCIQFRIRLVPFLYGHSRYGIPEG